MYFYFLIKRSSNTWKWLHLKFCPSESLQFDTLLLFESETLRVSSYLQKQEHHRCPYYHTVDRLYHPLDISSSRLYWPFSAGTEFSIIKPLDISASPSVISATLRVARGNCLPPVSFGSHRTTEIDIGSIFPIPQRRFAPFHADPPVPLFSPPPSLPSLTGTFARLEKHSSYNMWKCWSLVVLTIKIERNELVHALKMLDLVVFTIQLAFRGWIGPHRLYHPAAYISHFGPVQRWMI